VKQYGIQVWILILLLLLLTGCQSSALMNPTEATNAVELSTSAPITTLMATDILPVQSSEVTQSNSLEIAYLKDNPLTNTEEILAILDLLQARENTWFSHPGWLLFTSHDLDGSDQMSLQNIWSHTIDDHMNCREQFVYFIYETKILPYTIRLADNVTGTINPLLEGNFNPNFFYESGPECTLKSNWILTFQSNEDDYDFIIHDEALKLRILLNETASGVNIKVQAWKEEREGKQVLVMTNEINYIVPSQGLNIIDPQTWISHFCVKELQYFEIDLVTGLLSYQRGEYYDENGKIINTRLSGTNNGVQYSYAFYNELPDSISKVYGETKQVFSVFLSETKK
jgi:hypothetical protein